MDAQSRWVCLLDSVTRSPEDFMTAWLRKDPLQFIRRSRFATRPYIHITLLFIAFVLIVFT